MIKFKVGGTAYGDLPPIVDASGLPVVPTSVTFKTFKNGSTSATGDSVTLITHTDDDGLYSWSYNPAGESEFDTWRLQVKIVISGVDYYHHETLQAVVAERGTDDALKPTTAGRTLDVSATGEAGVDWANVGSPTTTVALTGTTVDLTTTALGAIWNRLTSSMTTAGSIGKKIADWVLGTDNKAMLSTDAQTGVVLPRVTLVDTTTTNTDMRGTDNSALASVWTSTLAAALAPIRSNTAQAGSSTTITLDASASSVANFYVPCGIYLTGGTGAGQFRTIDAYNGTTKVADVSESWYTTPDNTTTFAIRPEGIAHADMRALSGNELSAGYLKNIADYYGLNSKIAAQVEGIATDAISADSVSAAAVTKIQSGLASQSSVNDLPTNSELATALAAADDAVLAAISALNNLSAAEVNAEVLDVLNVDTFGELSAPPAASSSLRDKLTWIFMWARNRSTETSTQRKLYADDATTVVSTESVSDDGTTFEKGEAS